MCTEVKHGPSPQFEAATQGEFCCRVVGYYTTQNHLIAAGVASHHFQSNRPEKQRAELLGLRTAFLDWFITTYETLGGTRDDAYEQIEHIVTSRREKRRCIPLDDREVVVTEEEYEEYKRTGQLPAGK